MRFNDGSADYVLCETTTDNLDNGRVISSKQPVRAAV
jgi:hypothetical protein